jgi:outer membrane lipoprotein SlyB
LIGGAVGGLAGNEIAGRGDKTLGTILGAAGGALLGREIDRGGSRCR